MTERDVVRFGVIVNQLAAMFRVEISDPLLAAYWGALNDLSIDAVERACKRALSASKRMPMAAELRELSGDVPAGTRAVKAWTKVKASIRAIGAYQSVSFDDPAVNATIRALGGWTRLCSTDSEELDKWTRKDFERIYGAFAQGDISEEEGKHLPGIHESSNNGLGNVEAPIQIVTGMPVRRPSLTSAPGELIRIGDKK